MPPGDRAGLLPPSEISAVIINHNSGGTVLEVIRSLLRQDPPLKTILVVDNKSEDGSGAKVRAAFPGVRLIELEQNMGISYARNLGMSHANSKLVLMIDDDVYLEQGALQKLIRARQQTSAAIVVPRVVFHPGDRVIQCDGAQIHMTGTLSLLHRDRLVDSCPPDQAEVNAFIGACLLVNRQAVSAAGGFDEDYFFYFEDLELSYRLKALGHKIICAGHAVAYHHRGEGTPGLSFRGEGAYPLQRAYYIIRNRWLTMGLHFQWRTLLILSPVLVMYELATFGVAILRGWIMEWFRALVWVVKHGDLIRQRRLRWQSLRKAPDHEILESGPLPLASGFVHGRIGLLAMRMLDWVLNRYWMVVHQWL